MKNFISKHSTQAAYTTAESTFDKPHVSFIEELAGLADSVRYVEKPKPHNYANDYFTIVSLEDNNVISFIATNNNYSRSISISIDNGSTWTSYTSSTTGTILATLNTDDKLLIKGNNASYSQQVYQSGNWQNYSNKLSASKNFNIEGNIMSLTSGDDFISKNIFTSTYTFYQFLSSNTTLISAENLILPTTTLQQYCYQYMFTGCSSLTTAPELPATTLANYCYDSMFKNCTLLTAAPELPATTLVKNCYYNMFGGCTSLNYIKCLATDISVTNCTNYWVSNVASSGTFIKNASMSDWTTGNNGIPSGWTVQDAA